MRVRIFGASLLLGLAATTLGAPVALAASTVDEDHEPFLTASDDQLAPGQELRIEGYCPDPAAGPLTSDALTDINVTHDPESGPPNLLAEGVVAEDTAPGEYSATMECAGQELRVTFTVIDPDDPTDPPVDSLHIYPATARPGEKVSAQVVCDRTNEAPLTSPVLAPTTVVPHPEGHQPWALHGTTTVIADAEPGEYPVSVECAAGPVEAMITVLAADGGDNGDDGDNGDKGDNGDDGQVTRTPRGAPETGEGNRRLSLLATGLTLGAVAGAGAIMLRGVRR